MTIETLMKGLRAFIDRRRILATRRLAMDQIARQPEHLAADLNIPALGARPGITIVIISAIGCPIRHISQSFKNIDDIHKLYSFD
ncbi:hypothetical protein [Rhizobium sp. 18055]|jgi:hypothetical protein|uniref:hypothetical protein n=1 Tax=Rhizobium sp. 18055 TaxID=2681403 RepID=UPI001357D7FB|nr:hypothetical protein [Rhizobium sp. 18055]